MATIRIDDFLENPPVTGEEPIDAAVQIPDVEFNPVILRADSMKNVTDVPIDTDEKQSIWERFSTGFDLGIGQLPQLAGRTMFMFGDALMSEKERTAESGLKAPNDSIGRRIRRAGLTLNFATEDAIRKKFPETKERDFVRDLGTGASSLAASLGLGYLYGPIAAGVAFGGAATSEGFFEARKERSHNDALKIGTMLGVAERTLEFVGINKFIKVRGNFLQKTATRSLIEATQEFSQSVAEGTIKTSTGLREFKGRETLLAIAEQALYEGSLGAVLGGGAAIAVGSVEQATVESVIKEMGATDEQAEGIAASLMQKNINQVLLAVEEVAQEIDENNKKIPDVVKEEAAQKEKEKEITLEQVQEKQARQKVQEEKLSKAEIQRVAIEQVKDEQLKGRLTKLDTEVSTIDKEINSLERERRGLQKAEKSTKAVENKIDTLLEKRDKLDLQRGDILTTAKEKFDLEKEKLEIKGATLSKVARQGIVEKLREFQKGKRLGRAEVEAVQLQALQVLQDLDLDKADQGKFLKTVKNIKTEAQLKSATPKIIDRAETLLDKSVRRRLIKDIQKASKAKIAPDYKEQIDDILESFDLKARSEKTKAARESRLGFLARERQEGNLDFLPPDFFSNLGTTTIDQMNTDELQALHDQVVILQHVGSTKRRLLAEKSQKDLDDQADESATNIYDKTNSVPKQPESQRWLPVHGKRGLAAVADRIDAFFAAHRKVEFISRTLGIEQEIFEKIQSGINKELTTAEKAYGRLKESFQRFESEMSSMTTKEVDIEGVGIQLTREQMIGVALNSGNTGNLQRLLEGNELSHKEIEIINENLTDKERAFVEEVFDIVGSFFPDTVAVTEKLYGVRPPKVVGLYFPIIEDFKTSEQAQMRQAQQELFNNVFKTTFINRSFTHRRIGGTAPVNLNVFGLILNHVDSVIHYNSLAAEVRDVQKLIKHPQFHQAINDTLGPNIYNQFPSWLKDIANPQAMRAGNIIEKLAQGLRHNSTASLLAHRVSVSLLQGGSYFQTINEVGIKYGATGLLDFYKSPKDALEFVYSRSPIMKNRRQTFDRELRDFLKSKQITQLTKNRTPWNEVMFSWITAIDYMTTMPTWLGAYQKGLDESNNDEIAAALFADGVVRRTQPSGSVENLSAVMRGTQWQKMWTMFMSHFANMHNQLVSSMDQLKYGKDHPMRKMQNFSQSMFWLWAAPALLSSIIRSGGDLDDWKKHLKELALYPVGGILLVRDLMNVIVKGFDFGAPPALSGAVEIGRTLKSRDPQKKLRHGIKAVGILSGKIPTQYADTLDGAIDLYNDETDDFRRLAFSEWALKPSDSKKKRRRRR